MMTIILWSAAFVFLASSLQAADRTLIGKISDSTCGPAQAKRYPAPGGSDRICIRMCLKAGAKYVFVSGNKMYKIHNQDFADLEKNAGDLVYLTGNLKGDTITVSKIVASSAAKKST